MAFTISTEFALGAMKGKSAVRTVQEYVIQECIIWIIFFGQISLVLVILEQAYRKKQNIYILWD